MTQTISRGAALSAARPTPRSGPLHSALVTYRWELRKLTAQWWVRLSLLAYLLAPFAFAAVLRLQDTVPSDTLFGRWVHDSGFASPLVVLNFAGQWGLPLLVSLVAGDIFASEDRHGTWKTVLTRSSGRIQILTGKSLAAASYTVATVVITGAGSLASGVLLLGHDPLVGLSGNLVPSGRAAELVAISWATALPPALGFTALALLLSLATRNSIAGALGPAVIAGIMQMLSLAGGLGTIRRLLLTTPFDAWHGLFVAHPYYRPLTEGLLVCAGYLVVFAGAAYVIIRRRDFTEG